MFIDGDLNRGDVVPGPAVYSPKRTANTRKRKKETLSDYSEHATMHGISYVFEPDIVFASRIFWFITCVLLAVLAGYWIVGNVVIALLFF